MTFRAIKRTLTGAHLEKIAGSGGDLTFNLTAHRTTKAGTYECYTLEIRVCRYGVHRLLEELKAMHVRDRDRIRDEQKRIAREENFLVVPRE